ncbi:hypothetical protein RKD49_007620 [Streptomyces glaucescens]|uniref:gas vesicle protein GvpG n=1 Tax=unclassified Streptomyces TaxID=2593676 RepID=UPI00093E443C|nr:gas vesicle protein GvpG [Streptomyces sp. TSRI0107]OKJ88459.1 hypothetical protein AMK31_08200 [Streptomyces sp. TSRI0107]
MGLVGEVFLLPFAPVRGIGWVLDKVVKAAEDEYYDPAPVQEALINLERAREEGGLDEEEFAAQEQALLDRLQEIRAYHLQRGGQ